MGLLARRHPLVRKIRAWRRDRPARDADGVFVAEGTHLALDAIDAGADVVLAVVSPGLRAHPDGPAILTAFDAHGVPVWWTEDEVLSTLQDARTAQPVVTVVRRAIPRDPDPNVGPVVVACGLQDPGNLGSIVRTAAAAGACAVIACAGGADPFHPRAVRATAGALYRLPPTVGGRPADVLRALARSGFTTVGATAAGTVPYDRLDWTAPVAVVLGSEGGGLPADIVERLEISVSIPMQRGIESLSVGAAAAVLLFESARARRGRAPVNDG